MPHESLEEEEEEEEKEEKAAMRTIEVLI